jgi:ribonuclease-3
VADLADLAAAVGHAFGTGELLAQAMRHASWCHAQQPRPASNERLEFVGDAVLYLVVSDLLFRRFPERDEGALSRMRQQLVRESTLAELAEALGVGAHLQFVGTLNPRMLGDAMEAVIGAVFVDAGFATTAQLIERLLGDRVAHVGTHDSRDFKTRLQEQLQRAGHAPPTYKLVDTRGPDHAREYVVAAMVGDDEWGRGSGSSQQAASQRAAEQALAR